MSKILINNTAIDIDVSDVGVTIPANSSYTIPSQDYSLWSSSDDIVGLVGNGDVDVNDGSKDLSKADAIRIIQGGFSNTIRVEEDLLALDRIKVQVSGTLSDGLVSVDAIDATSQYLDEKITIGSTKLTKQINSVLGARSIAIDVNQSQIQSSQINNDANFINSSGAPVQVADISNFETSSQLNVRDTNDRNRSNHSGTQVASTISDLQSAVQGFETNTSISFSVGNNTLSYTGEDGTQTDIDLSIYLDNTNLSQIITGILNSSSGICTFTRDDNSTFTVDFSSLNDQAAINAAITIHEQSIDNHTDVDISTTSPYLGSTLIWNGSKFTPGNSSNYRAFINRTDGEINQLSTFREYSSLAVSIPETGDYKVSWSYTWSVNATNQDFIARIQIDDSTKIMDHQQEPKDTGGTGVVLPNTEGGSSNTSTNQRYQCSGFFIINMTIGNHTIDLDYKGSAFDIEPAIYKSSLSIERWV